MPPGVKPLVLVYGCPLHDDDILMYTRWREVTYYIFVGVVLFYIVSLSQWGTPPLYVTLA